MNVIRSEFPWSPPLLHYKTTLFYGSKLSFILQYRIKWVYLYRKVEWNTRTES